MHFMMYLGNRFLYLDKINNICYNFLGNEIKSGENE